MMSASIGPEFRLQTARFVAVAARVQYFTTIATWCSTRVDLIRVDWLPLYNSQAVMMACHKTSGSCCCQSEGSDR
jgi:hypothetical protein